MNYRCLFVSFQIFCKKNKTKKKLYDLFFFRTFVIDPLRQTTLQEHDSVIVHWLHAINPDLFTKQIIR